nr:MAG TPA: Photosynthesis system II assembly factor YCF48 [Bacteriophage sp.]
MRVQDLQIEDKTYKDLFQQQYLADGYNAAQHTLTTPRLVSKKMTADKFNEPAADMENLQDDWFVGVVKYVADLVVKFGTNVEYIMQDVGEYSDNTQYHLGQVVTYQGSKWICIVDTQITVPPSISGDTWLQVPNGVDGLSGVDFGISDLYASSQDWDSAKLYSKNDLVYYATTDISNKPTRTMLFAALGANSGINPTSAGQTAWLKIFDQPATKIVISENEPVDKYTGQIWGEKSKMPNYYSDGSPYYNLTMHQYNGNSWDDLYPKTTVANVVDGVTDKLITDPTSYGQTIKEGTILGYENDTWTDVNDYSQSAADARYLKLSGGTVTGPLQIAKGTATNSAIRLDEIQNGVAMTDGNVTTLDGTASSSDISSALIKSLDISAQENQLQSIADAIKNKKGSTATIQASKFATEIRNLPELPKWVKGDMASRSRHWYGVAYGSGTFVAINGGTYEVAYSTDGITWKISSDLPSAVGWVDVAYGGGKFGVIASSSSYYAYSTDGINWTEGEMPDSVGWQSICYGAGKFVVVSDNSDRAAYSTNGISWTLMNMPQNAAWQSICYGAGKFVAVIIGASAGAYSSDGINWTEMTFPNSRKWHSVCYGNGKFVTVAYDSNIAAYSTDGISWTEVTLPMKNTWSGLAYGAGKFVSIAYNSPRMAYIQDSHTTLGLG